MTNFKRKKPKQARAGCLMCKPWKVWGNRKDRKKPKDREPTDLENIAYGGGA
jgi:hypothetical protein